jgi:lactoylglutathione lyase
METSGSDPARFYGVRLLVNDFAASWRFYREGLGLIPQKGHGAPPYGEFVSKGRSVVSLFDRKLMSAAVGLPRGRNGRPSVGRVALVFEVPDVNTLARRLERRGVIVVQGPTDRPEWRLRTVHVQDPDGNLVEFCSTLKSR